LLGQRLLKGDQFFARAWNFGPSDDETRSVISVVEALHSNLPSIKWCVENEEHPHEAGMLQLDSTMARKFLGWCSAWPFDQGLMATASWYQQFYEKNQVATQSQIENYIECASSQKINWTQGAA
jgi:CDP-glucose 4,6-dehydratase